MPLGMEVGLSPGDSVLDGDPAFLPTKGVEPSPQFSAHFYCGQTDGCIKMPLGMKVGLILGDFGLDGDPAPPPPKREAEAGGRVPPIFGPWLLWPNGWMDQDPLGMEVGLGPVHIVLDGDTALLPQTGG